jgi:uncharacterized protein (DUF1330 family)
MAAYLFADIEVTDPAAYEEYRRLVPAVIAAFGGRYLVRGGASRVLEGPATLDRQVILEFPDMERALAFYESDEYAPLKASRRRCSSGQVVVIEGV